MKSSVQLTVRYFARSVDHRNGHQWDSADGQVRLQDRVVLAAVSPVVVMVECRVAQAIRGCQEKFTAMHGGLRCSDHPGKTQTKYATDYPSDPRFIEADISGGSAQRFQRL